MFRAAVLTVSDRCSRGEREDESGKVLIEMLKGSNAEIAHYDVVADEVKAIKEKLTFYSDVSKVDLVLTTGGTGLGPRDVTPEATIGIAERMVPGISELIRSEGFKKTRNAILSRGVSCVRKSSIIVNLPGSPKGARESLASILDLIPHALLMLKGESHPDLSK